jgi:hypothetical protein
MRPPGERIMPGGRGQEGAWGLVRGCLPVGACLSVRGVISRGGRGRGERAASLTWVRGAQGRCPGDKMIDWVSPPWGVRPLSLIRPPAWPSGARAPAGSG